MERNISSEDKMTIGEIINKARENRNLSLEQLAKQVGDISKATLSRIETSKGKKNDPSFSLVVKIARVLDVPLENFVYGIKSESEMIQDNFEEIIQQSGINDSQKRILREINDFELKKAIMELGPLKEYMTKVKKNLFHVLRVESEKLIQSDGSVEQAWYVKIKALKDLEHNFRQRYSRSVKFYNRIFLDFGIVGNEAEVTHEKKENLNPVFIVRDDDFVYFNIPFQRPVHKDETIQLKWKEVYKSGHVMSKASLRENKDFVERSAYFVLYEPTDYLYKSITFPEGFSINEKDVYPDVEKQILGRREKNLTEIERIKKSDMFSLRKRDNKLTAVLEVSNPKPGSAYYVRWNLPD